MKKEGIISALVLLAVVILLFWYTPDSLSFIFLLLITVLILTGIIVGLYPMVKSGTAFESARMVIKEATDAQTVTPWYVIRKKDKIFDNTALDEQYFYYREKAYSYYDNDEVVCDIEEYINEEYIRIHVWNDFVSQIPNALTGIGVLGTFFGLLTGLNGISFTTVNIMVGSVERLLDGIRIAFYSSASGVILSILFNLLYNMLWNRTLQKMELFIRDFHLHVIPSKKEQLIKRDYKIQKAALMDNHKEVIDCLEQILRELEKQRVTNDTVTGR